jgi:hypothetical protein
MLGLHNPEQFTPAPLDAVEARPWIKGAYLDASNTMWYELDLSGLTRDSRFLEAGIVPLVAAG